MRHCESIWNGQKRYSGHKDIPLTYNGTQHANMIGKFIGKFPIKTLISSDLQRAINTAKPIEKSLQIPLELDSNFREVNFGKLEGLKISEIKRFYPQVWRSYLTNPIETRFPGGETCSEALKRSTDSLKKMYNSNSLNGTLIVMHGTILRIILCYLVGIDTKLFRNVFCGVDNGSISAIKIQEFGQKTDLKSQGTIITFNQNLLVNK